MILESFINAVEYINPDLFEELNGRAARAEMDALTKAQVPDRSTLLSIRGEPQRIVRTESIGCRLKGSHWLLEVPVIVVEKR